MNQLSSIWDGCQLNAREIYTKALSVWVMLQELEGTRRLRFRVQGFGMSRVLDV